MRSIDTDARRYTWCRSRALWFLGMPMQTYVEDAKGAFIAGQDGLLRYSARMVGEACVVALNLALNYERPVPTPAMRISWALERLRGHELWQPCWELILGPEETTSKEILEKCESLVERVSAIVGEIPNILSPEGHYPAIAMARDWIKLMEAVGEEPPVPGSWTLPI